MTPTNNKARVSGRTQIFRVCNRSLARTHAAHLLFRGAGAGSLGSGLFVTDPVASFPASSREHDDPDGTRSVASTRGGRLHNLCVIPISAGIPVAASICGMSAVRRREYHRAILIPVRAITKR
jgi:hypothetical protein